MIASRTNITGLSYRSIRSSGLPRCSEVSTQRQSHVGRGLLSSTLATSSRVTVFSPLFARNAPRSTLVLDREHKHGPNSLRNFSSSNLRHARAATTEWDDSFQDSHSTDHGDRLSRDEEIPKLTRDDVRRMEGSDVRRRYQHFEPPPVPDHQLSHGTTIAGEMQTDTLESRESKPAVYQEWEPTESDIIAFSSANAADLDHEYEHAGYSSTDPASAPPLRGGPEQYLESYPEVPPVTTSRRSRLRRHIVHNLAPMPAGEAVSDDEARYDWRARAVSQRGARRRAGEGNSKRRDKIWYPDVARRRQRANMKELQPGHEYYDEVKRYHDHFVPLLEAEFAEEQRLHAERQSTWPEHKLIKEGYMLENLGATAYGSKRRGGEHVYTFSRVTKDASRMLGFHRFRLGTSVEISRLHPHHDYVKLDGKVHNPTVGATRGKNRRTLRKLSVPNDVPTEASGSVDKLLGTVFSVMKDYIRVGFDAPIEGIESGKWRLDIGCSDFTFQKQVAALQNLHYDPTSLERADAARRQQEVDSQTRLKGGMSEIDDAVASLTPRSFVQESVLQGTNLRDKILRAFQEDFVPYDTTITSRSSASAVSAASANSTVPDTIAHELKPTDIDATPIPTPHIPTESAGILASNQMIQSWTKRYRSDNGREPVVVEGDPVVPLNPSQTRAIAMMLSERLSLVQGPPGTGKTLVIIETIKLLKQHWQIPHPILVTAHTNAAVDNLLAGLRGHGVKATRVGREEMVREDLRDYAMEREMERHPMYPEFETGSQRVEEINRHLHTATGKAHVDLIAERGRLQKRSRYLRMSMIRDVMLDADVICTTCLSATSWPLEQIDFPIVFLDEASMATEPLSLITLMKGSSHVAIIGDHKQLPPIIISEAAHAGGLSTSLFERLIHEKNIPSIMLDTQYRMHPQISSFPNQAFYGSALQDGTAPDGVVDSKLRSPDTAFLLTDEEGKRQNLTFVHQSSFEDAVSKSIANDGQASRVCDVIADLLYRNPNLQGKDIGVITPYSAQIRLLEEYLHEDRERYNAFTDLLGKDRVQELEDIEIKTVDGFEGREKDVIIFSTVRNNQGGWIGFLGDWRRLNVGLTRAKRALILIGSADHLARAKTGKRAEENLPSGGAAVWREFMAHLDKEGLILRE